MDEKMSFIDYFGEISDPRKDINVKHNLLDVIFLTIVAVISGCEGWKDIYDFGRVKLSWLRQYREFKNGYLDRSGDLEQKSGKIRAIPVLFVASHHSQNGLSTSPLARRAFIVSDRPVDPVGKP